MTSSSNAFILAGSVLILLSMYLIRDPSQPHDAFIGMLYPVIGFTGLLLVAISIFLGNDSTIGKAIGILFGILSIFLIFIFVFGALDMF